MIADNLKSVTERIAKCCEKIGRPPDSVKLIAVTKEASIGQMNEAMASGASRFGENRVQDALTSSFVVGATGGTFGLSASLGGTGITPSSTGSGTHYVVPDGVSDWELTTLV